MADTSFDAQVAFLPKCKTFLHKFGHEHKDCKGSITLEGWCVSVKLYDGERQICLFTAADQGGYATAVIIETSVDDCQIQVHQYGEVDIENPEHELVFISKLPQDVQPIVRQFMEENGRWV